MNVKEYVLVPRHIYNNLTQKECRYDKNSEQIDVNKTENNEDSLINSVDTDMIDTNIHNKNEKESKKLDVVNNDNIPKETKIKPVVDKNKGLHPVNVHKKKKKSTKKNKHIDTLYIRKHYNKYNWIPY